MCQKNRWTQFEHRKLQWKNRKNLRKRKICRQRNRIRWCWMRTEKWFRRLRLPGQKKHRNQKMLKQQTRHCRMIFLTEILMEIQRKFPMLRRMVTNRKQKRNLWRQKRKAPVHCLRMMKVQNWFRSRTPWRIPRMKFSWKMGQKM